jgi:hypothetical protein
MRRNRVYIQKTMTGIKKSDIEIPEQYKMKRGHSGAL